MRYFRHIYFTPFQYYTNDESESTDDEEPVLPAKNVKMPDRFVSIYLSNLANKK